MRMYIKCKPSFTGKREKTGGFCRRNEKKREMSEMRKCKLAVIGFGQRGYDYAEMIAKTPTAELTALCDTDPKRAEVFARELGLEAVPRYNSPEELLAKGDFDAAILTTPDFMHRECAVACCNAKKSIMLEKPMAPTAAECREIIRAARENQCTIQIGFVLRSHPVFRRVLEVARSGVLGQILNIGATEHIGVMHGASYMRRWHRKLANSGGFILAKCSHDLDIIATAANSHVRRVASFGSLDYFTTDKLKYNYCSECPDANCRYRFKGEFVRMTPEEKANPSARPFDLCVYNKDKELVDHEVVMLDFANGIKANFALNLFAQVPKRTISLCGVNGILYADTAEECIHIHYSDGKGYERIDCKADNTSGHGGSDQTFLNEFIDCVLHHKKPQADYMAGLASTVVGNAVEQARLTNQVVEIPEEAYQL